MCLSIALGGCCCAGEACCSCFQSIFGTSFRQSIRLGYTMISFTLTLYLFLMLFVLTDWLSSIFISFGFCSEETSTGTSVLTCLGVGGVYRMSFALFILFILIAICCFERLGFAQLVNEGCWGLKVLLVLCLAISFSWIPNSFFDVYAAIALWTSLVYLFFQSAFLIDFSYRWSESWFDHMAQGRTFYKVASISVTLLLYLGSLGLIVLMFQYFWTGSCSGNKFILLLCPFLVVLFTVLNILQFNPSGSILGAGFMSLLTVFSMGSALASRSDGVCNPFSDDVESLSLWQGLLCSIWPFLTCFYLTVFNEKSGEDEGLRGKTTGTTGVLDQENIKEETQEEKEELRKGEYLDQREKKYEAYKNNSYIYFHTFLGFMGIYLSMLLSNWGTIEYAGSDGNDYGELDSKVFWIKFGTAVAIVLLYVWTLIAPRILPNRDFSI